MDIQYHDAYHDQYVTGHIPNPTCVRSHSRLHVDVDCAQASPEVTLRVTLVLIWTSVGGVPNDRCGKLYMGHPTGDRLASAQPDYMR